MNAITRALTLASIAIASYTTSAAVTCTQTAGSGSCSVTGSGPYTVTITAQSSDATFVVAGSTSDRITVINVTIDDSSSGNKATLLIGSDIAYIGYLDQINMVNTTRPCVVDRLRIEHDVGILEVTQANDGHVKGDVTGDVTLQWPSTGTYLQPRIHDVRVEGDFLGDITGTYDGTIDGTVFGLTVEGSLGTAMSPCQINISHNIDKLIAGDIYADINTLQRDVSTLWAGYIAQIETDTQWGGSGGLHGTITTTRVGPSMFNATPIIRVRGDFDCEMELTGFTVPSGAHAGTYPGYLEAPVKIDHDLTGGAFIKAQSSGLKAQVVINDDNNGSTWDGDVIIGTTTLSSTPYYSQTAASLGGGSVGLVAFSLHGTSCVPVDSTSTQEPTVYPDACPSSILLCDPEAPNNVMNARSWATMRMYGPVVFAGEGKPCTIERRPYPGGGSWTDVTADFRFDIYTSSDGMGTPDAGERVIRIRRENTSCLKYFPVGYDYRVRPVTDHVRCKGVDGGNSVNVYAFEYNFTLPYDCEESLLGRFDENNDDNLNATDATLWAGAPRDLDGDTDTDAADLALLMRAIDEFN